MATAQLNEKRVDRPYLYPAPTAGVSNLSGLNVVEMRDDLCMNVFKLLLAVGADLNLTHRADPIVTRGWKPTV